ncbi:MAG: DUF512 domain-containing protein [Moorellaceae bacterium]
MDKWQLVVLTAARYNILPLTSTCNLRCVFCSHRQNPPGVESFTMAPLTPEEAESLLDYLDARRKIVIGESATRLVEGEPLTHPSFFPIMHKLRRRFPQTPVEITTNGLLLDEGRISALKPLQPLEMNLSVNSVTPAGRLKLLGIKDTLPVLERLENLTRVGIVWHGSLVAYPSLVGGEDISATIRGLAAAGATTIRVFLPGFTRLAPLHLRFDPDVWRRELEDLLEELRSEVAPPLLLEPPYLRDLTPVVAGVLTGSPAEAAGMKRGDIILSVDGEAPRSRVEAFNLISRAGRRRLKIRRLPPSSEREIVEEVTLDLLPGQKSGLVWEWDCDPKVLEAVQAVCQRYCARRVLLFTSEPAFAVLKLMLRPIEPIVKVQSVRNHFFGGSITAAGLLTVEDFIRAWQERGGTKYNPDLILLPGLAFDFWGRDLLGRHYEELARVAGVPVETISI